MKRIGIEALLRWAYVQELPKAQAGSRLLLRGPAKAGGGWDAMTAYAALGTTVDDGRVNRWGVLPVFGAGETVVHPDAEAVGEAVARLGDCAFEAPDGYDLLGDLVVTGGAAMTDAERADCHDRGLAIARIGEGRLSETIRRCAVLGFPVAPGAAACERRVLRGAYGGPAWFRRAERACPTSGAPIVVEIDGFDRALRRPWPGAYQRSRLTPDPVGFVEERVEWQAMVLALASLAADLDGALLAHAVEGPALTLWPWEAGPVAAAGPRVIEAKKSAGAR